MNAFRQLLHSLPLVAAAMACATPATAALFGIGENAQGLPPVVLEADYDYYGDTGTLSKLRGKHLRPPYALPVSTVAIVDHLNAELEKQGQKIAPQVAITDRLQWGRFEIFSVLSPMANGKKISRPTPVICASRYDCKVDMAFEDRLKKDTRALLAWTRYYLMKNHRSRQLNKQQVARVTSQYRLLSIYDHSAGSSAAINFWLDLHSYPQRRSIDLSVPAQRTASPNEVDAVVQFAAALKALPAAELNEQSFAFNQLMQEQLQSLFAGQYSYPYTRLVKAGTYPEYSREDLSAIELAQQLRSWKSLQPLAYISAREQRYLIFSVNKQIDDLHIMPISCTAQSCGQLHWEQLRASELRLLNHPLILTQLAQSLGEN